MSLTVKHPFTSAIADDPTAAAAGEVLPSHWNTNHTVTGSVDATQMPALTGDVTTAAGAVATTLATVNSNTGTFGDSTHIAQVTLNGKGLVTAASSVAIAVSATPAGSDTQVQFNDSSAFGGNSGFTFDKSTGIATVKSRVYFSPGSSADAGVQPAPGAGANSFFVGSTQSVDAARTRIDGNEIWIDTPSGPVWKYTSANLLPFNDNTGNIGEAATNVATMYHYTSALKPIAVASLPGSPAAGMLAAVNNATAPVIAATVSGGGAAFALVCYNGSAWKVVSI